MSTDQRRRRERLLIVDCRQEIRGAAERALRGSYDTVFAYDGEMALEILNQDARFDAVILNCRLYETSGFDVLLRLHTMHMLETVPVIAMGEPGAETEALSMGALEFVREPVNFHALGCRLRNLLDFIRTEGNCDFLTGLYNRRKFLAETRRLLQVDRRRKYCLIYTNIRRFRTINDQFGPRMGDMILRELAQLFRKLFPDAVLARFAGDHFAICCLRSELDEDALRGGVNTVIQRCRLQRQLRVTFGVYDIEDREMPVEQMGDRAEMAMWNIREGSDVLCAWYDERLRREMLEEQEITDGMENALRSGQFQVCLQPIYSLTTGTPVSAEALIRWVHPQRGVIPPSKFIPIFERNGFITKLDAYIWETVFQYLTALRRFGYPDFPISTNISRMDFYNPELCGNILMLAEKYGISPSLFRIEVTESSYMDDPNQLLEMIREFNASGFQVLMDDFGSGYSSLNMLMNIPVSTLKIDMGFVRDIGISERSNSVVSSVIRMARWLEMSVIAEGVENREQLEYLKSIGCDRIQGYYFSRPLPYEEFTMLLSGFNTRCLTEPPRVFDKVDAAALWQSLNRDNRSAGGILGAVGLYEVTGDLVELTYVNDAYYQIMETTPRDLFRDTQNALAWICEGDREPFLAALKRARETRERQDLVIDRYIRSATIKRLYLSVGFIGNKANRALLAVSIRDVSELEGLERLELTPPGGKRIPARGVSGRPTVLIVEDNQVNRIMLLRMLSDEYDVLEAANGKEGLSLLERAPEVSAVLLDIIMPVMDGYEFLERRQRDERLCRVPVLVLSQSETRSSELRALELGAADFMRKPYEPAKVKNMIRRLTAKKEAEP